MLLCLACQAWLGKLVQSQNTGRHQTSSCSWHSTAKPLLYKSSSNGTKQTSLAGTHLQLGPPSAHNLEYTKALPSRANILLLAQLWQPALSTFSELNARSSYL